MREEGQPLHALPILLRYPIIGAAALGLLGAAIGLVLGLRAYPPTAWAAVLEVGVPATVLGAIGGGVAASVVHAVRRLHHR